ncbi:hypothetical protein F4809DRAFT_626324 [Biscogniauxia mediterranea]|nr:hypothetical protein F4809DRAFT_626324 [Biscogniauxia mediterranea]
MSLPRHPRALLPLLPRRPTITTTTTTTPPAPPAPSSSRAPFSTSPRLAADIIRRPRRPYTFTQLVQLSDGSTYTARTTSPHAVYKSTKDTRNHVLWQPRERSLRNVEVDEAGKLAAFRGRFGTMWDADAGASGAAGSSTTTTGSSSSAADDQELKELMEAQGVTAARKLRKQMEKMQRNAEWEKRQMEKQAGAGADAGADAAAPEEGAGASEGGGGEGLSDLIAKYSTPQSQVPNDRTPVVRKKK